MMAKKILKIWIIAFIVAIIFERVMSSTTIIEADYEKIKSITSVVFLSLLLPIGAAMAYEEKKEIDKKDMEDLNADSIENDEDQKR